MPAQCAAAPTSPVAAASAVPSSGDGAAPALAADGTDRWAASSSSSKLRRVASAPAFKHASCYREASATAAVAAAANEAAASAAPQQQQQQARQRRPAPVQPPLRQTCGSCCSSGGCCNCLEVYVVSRSFTEFGGPLMKKLPPDARQHLVDMGICHYMTVFKTPDGQLVQFDFGPQGGDVQKAHGPIATLLRRARAAALAAQQEQQQQHLAAASVAGDGSSGGGVRGMVHSPSAPVLPVASLDLAGQGGQDAAAAVLLQLQEASSGGSNRRKRGVVGEIRERQLEELPPACMYMGRTSLSLEDIRQYNAAQGLMTYTLHENDCRHYVNSLVQYTTGVERSTQHLKRHYFVARHTDKWLWYGWFISATQLVTDVGNWSHVQAGAAVTLLAVTGRSTLASLKTLALPAVVPALKGLPSLLPSSLGLTAAAAAAAAGGAAPAAGGGGAAAAAAGGATIISALATTLKLPASLLLKRPLAAGAAAGSAGAAAAAMRDTTAAAAGSSGGGGNGGTGPQYRPPALVGAFGSLGRPLRVLGDGMTHGLRSAVLGIRRLAVGNRQALQRLHGQGQHPGLPAARTGAGVAVGEPALAGVAAVAGIGAVPGADGGFWWWGGRRRRQLQLQGAQQQQQQQQQQLAVAAAAPRAWWGLPRRQLKAGRQLAQQAASPGAVIASAPVSAAAAAATGLGDASSASIAAQQQLQQQVGQQRQRGSVVAWGQHVGRHVAWLGSAAARAVMSIGGSGRARNVGSAVDVPAVVASPIAAAAGIGGMSSSSSQMVLAGSSNRPLSRRSWSMPSLALVSAGPAAAIGDASLASSHSSSSSSGGGGGSAGCSPVASTRAATAVTGGSSALLYDRGFGSSGGCGSSGAAAAAAMAAGVDGLDASDFVWCNGGCSSSQIVCSSIGGRPSGRQVLNLPPPRLSWAKRATQAMIVRQ